MLFIIKKRTYYFDDFLFLIGQYETKESEKIGEYVDLVK